MPIRDLERGHAPGSAGLLPSGRRKVRVRFRPGPAALVLVGLHAACWSGTMPVTPPAVPPPAAPAGGDEAAREGRDAVDWEVPPPGLAAPEAGDPILDSPALQDPALEERVAYWIEAWRRGAWGRWPLHLERMALYEPLVEEILEAEGLPRSLRFLPLLESGYSPDATSPSAAVGLWQLMAGTAAGLGLVVSPAVDERRDPVRSTAAAARYLSVLHERFGSWLLALAAYNAGPGRLDRLIGEHAPDAEPDDSLYIALAQHLPAETREFVPRLVAGARVASDPDGYGLPARPPRPPPESRTSVEHRVSASETLERIARRHGTTVGALLAANPGVEPRRLRVGQVLRVPGAGEGPPPHHVVARGDTLWGIARRYGVALEDLLRWNGLNRRSVLRPGQRVGLGPRAQ